MKSKPRIVIQFCVTAAEKRAIQRAAKRERITMSLWLRALSLSASRQH